MTDFDNLSLPTVCPYCGRTNDRHHGTRRPGKPDAGAVGICWECGNVFVFESETTVRRPTADEQADIDADPDVTLARAACRDSYLPSEASAFTRAFLGAETSAGGASTREGEEGEPPPFGAPDPSNRGARPAKQPGAPPDAGPTATKDNGDAQ